MVAAVSTQNTQLHPTLHRLPPEEDPNATTTSEAHSTQQTHQPASSTFTPEIVNPHARALAQYGLNAKLPPISGAKLTTTRSPTTSTATPVPQASPNSSSNSGGFFGWVKGVASTATSAVSGFMHSAVNTIVNDQRAADARTEGVGNWIDSQFNSGVQNVNHERTWLQQNGGVVGQATSAVMGFAEGAAQSLYGMGKGLVQMGYGAASLVNPNEWMANSQGNIQRIQSTVNSVLTLGKIANLANPGSWITNREGNAQLAGALWNSASKSFRSDPANFLGNATATVATFFIPGGEAGAAADAAKVADVAADTTKVFDTAQSAADAANTAQDATKAANTAQDATRAGTSAQDAANLATAKAQYFAHKATVDAINNAEIAVDNAQAAADFAVAKSQGAADEAVQVAKDTAQTAVNMAQNAARDTTKLPPGTIFSGHGSYSAADGMTTIPPGTSLTVYAEHGATISDSLGNAIETGGDLSKVYQRTYVQGSNIPNYTLHPPTGLRILGSPVTVKESTPLSDLLKPGMGDCHWAACLSDRTAPGYGKSFYPDGVVDHLKDTITIYRH